MSKKLSVILILAVLVVSCSMVPVMAADLSWDLDAESATTIEMEWVFSGVLENPSQIPEKNPNDSTSTFWLYNEDASNDYLYTTGWETADMTRTFNVVSDKAQYYNVEFVAGVREDKSAISVYVGNTLIGDTNTDEGTEVFKIGEPENWTYINSYSLENVPLNAGNNTVRVCTTRQYSTRTDRNAYEMDYIKFTPVEGAELPFAVSGVEDNTVDPSCISVIFNKPVTSAEGIVVTAQHGTAQIAVDANNANKVKITNVAGRTTITVPDTFTGGGKEAVFEAYVGNVFAYPVTEFEDNSYAYKYDSTTRKVTAYFGAAPGMWTVRSSTRKVKGFIALYDGDKMVAAYQKDFSLPNENNSISVSHDAGVKFTEAKVFGFLEVEGELVPIAKPTTRRWNGTLFVK